MIPLTHTGAAEVLASPANRTRYPDGCETYGEAVEAFLAQADDEERAEQAESDMLSAAEDAAQTRLALNEARWRAGTAMAFHEPLSEVEWEILDTPATEWEADFLDRPVPMVPTQRGGES